MEWEKGKRNNEMREETKRGKGILKKGKELWRERRNEEGKGTKRGEGMINRVNEQWRERRNKDQ